MAQFVVPVLVAVAQDAGGDQALDQGRQGLPGQALGAHGSGVADGRQGQGPAGAVAADQGLEHRLAGQGLVQSGQLFFEKAPEHVVQAPETGQARQGEGGALGVLVCGLAVEAVHDHLEPGQLHRGLGGGEPGQDLVGHPGVERHPAAFAGPLDRLPGLEAVHALDADATAEEVGQEGLELGHGAQVFLTHHEDQPDIPLQAGQIVQGLAEGAPLLPVAEDEQLFELVEDKVDGLEVVEIQGTDALRERGAGRGRGEGVAGELGVEGLQEVGPAAHGDGQTVGGLEFVGQTALHQAGLARAGDAIDQQQTGGQQAGIEFLGLAVAAEEDVAVGPGVGVEEFEGITGRGGHPRIHR